jgi:hypothetical protein
MSSLTIFLAKFLGLYCIVVALAMMIRKQSKIGAIKALIGDPPLLLLAEVLALAAGIAMIVGRNIWALARTSRMGFRIAASLSAPSSPTDF